MSKQNNLYEIATTATNILHVGEDFGCQILQTMMLANAYSVVTYVTRNNEDDDASLKSLLDAFPDRIIVYNGSIDDLVLKFDLIHITISNESESVVKACNKLATRKHQVVLDGLSRYPNLLIGPVRESHAADQFIGKYRTCYDDVSVELAICRYKRDLNWLRQIDTSNVSIYVHNKGDDTLGHLKHLQRLAIRKIPNVGVDQYSNIRYIVDNYDNLPEVVVFCHDDTNEHDDIYDDVGIAFSDLESRIQYMIEEALTFGFSRNASTWKRFGYALNPHFHLKLTFDDINNIPETFGEWFVKVIRNDVENIDWNNMMWFKNAIFAVRKDYILSRPKWVYERLCDQFVLQRSELDHFMERCWYYLLNLDSKIL
jgi:phage gp36-like protein